MLKTTLHPALRPTSIRTRRSSSAAGGLAAVGVLALLSFASLGCDQPPPIRQYTISTEVPAALQSQDRMLAAIIPQESNVWFFKLTGPVQAVDSVADQLRQFVQQVKFVEGKPDLASLPADWVKQAGERPMRLATVTIPTESFELELAISDLPKSGDWDDQVAMNVNRWRGQMKLAESAEHWAGAEPLHPEDASGEPEASDEPAVWVDISGEIGSATPPMSAMASSPFAAGGELPAGHPEIPASGSAGSASPAAGAGAPADAGAEAADKSAADKSATADDAAAANPGGLKYDAPPQWRSGKMSMMRMAAFEIGPADRSAELTIIQAGGDLRGNVDRWLGQVRGDSPPSEVVDAALKDAQQLRVSGRDAQRFILSDGKDSSAESQAIDATIVPMDGGMSLFIKATGPAATLAEQRDAIGQFLESLSLPQ